MITIKKEARIGETRYAVLKGKQIAELHLDRWSGQGLPRAGERFAGRIRKIDKGLAAAFVDLGSGPDGFLNFTLAGNAPRLTEGRMIEVVIIREAEADKGPLLRFDRMSDADKPGALAAQSLEDRLRAAFPAARWVDAQIDEFDAYLSYEYALHEGGYLYIEPTRAALTFDVDVAQGKNKRDVGIAAAKTIANLLRVRNMGGLILIDFPNFRKTKDRKDVWQTLADYLENDPAITKLEPMSRFGAVLLTRQKTGRSLTQIMHGSARQPTPETLALEGINRLFREGRANPGAQLTLYLPKAAKDWLDAAHIDWNTPLSEALGHRYSLDIGETIDVQRDRSA